MPHSRAAQIVVMLTHARASSWSNQELAEFYRVGDILRRIGWDLEIDRGYTDEGEPWLVYCDARSGDVIMHFAKIDDGYVIDGASLGAPLRGPNFPTLLRRLIDVYGPAEQAQSARRTGSVSYAHPLASLAALVAAVCALSDMTCRDVATEAAAEPLIETANGVLLPIEDQTVEDQVVEDQVNVNRARLPVLTRAEATRGDHRHDASPAAKFGAVVVDLVVSVMAFATGSLSMDLLDTDNRTASASHDSMVIAGGIGRQLASATETREVSDWQHAETTGQTDAQTASVHIEHLIDSEMATNVGVAMGERLGIELGHLPLEFEFGYLRLVAGAGAVPSDVDGIVALDATVDAPHGSTASGPPSEPPEVPVVSTPGPVATRLVSVAAAGGQIPAEPYHGLAAAETTAQAFSPPLSAVQASPPSTSPADSALGAVFGFTGSFSDSVGLDVANITWIETQPAATPPTDTGLSTTNAPPSILVAPGTGAAYTGAPVMSDGSTLAPSVLAPNVSSTPEATTASVADTIDTFQLDAHLFTMRRGNDHNFGAHHVVDVLKFFIEASGAFKVVIDGNDYYFIDTDAYAAGAPPIEMESKQLADGATMHLIGIGDVFDRMSVHFA